MVHQKRLTQSGDGIYHSKVNNSIKTSNFEYMFFKTFVPQDLKFNFKD